MSPPDPVGAPRRGSVSWFGPVLDGGGMGGCQSSVEGRKKIKIKKIKITIIIIAGACWLNPIQSSLRRLQAFFQGHFRGMFAPSSEARLLRRRQRATGPLIAEERASPHGVRVRVVWPIKSWTAPREAVLDLEIDRIGLFTRQSISDRSNGNGGWPARPLTESRVTSRRWRGPVVASLSLHLGLSSLACSLASTTLLTNVLWQQGWISLWIVEGRPGPGGLLAALVGRH